jgi:hypothetical protein
MERDEIEAAIRSAFAGVRLGSGVSLRQSKVIDNYGRGYTQAEFDALRRSEVIDDWTRVPDEELIQGVVPHLDPDGLRYYLPALMLWMLAHHDDVDLWRSEADMTVIGTTSTIAPFAEFAGRIFDVFDSSFSLAQRNAIASYVEALPRLVHLDREEGTRVERSLKRYWGQYLPPSP